MHRYGQRAASLQLQARRVDRHCGAHALRSLVAPAAFRQYLDSARKQGIRGAVAAAWVEGVGSLVVSGRTLA